MPQMAPMSWLIMYMLFTFMFILLIIFNYFTFLYLPNKKNYTILNKKKMNWKW
uniref:ATP synthase complex subunit 8 n=1 Tax=Eucryptorrhynchus scrobiculatus TaxID=1552824 RepID=A0A410PAD0_EUCSC|nr:ATP synthase F0 subunit 8 [Eucryptorrhynchus scrobiculatus]QGA70742.1 ATP synthase F0 subunit 8 [Eucryptorrhynchus scrobiculatus]QGA70746.1 ATP synthase F0 subunit 8 [Eucryptorrhynchus scrobiculatus]QGA70747.1 ATP synthase F0 subunit 8 [Eucryptorrhynchus scrobiculatus]QGA70748.1 ATP synthase F0 subunit 8 [Eucryptorrhynchus scrobiculatus]